MNKKKLLLTAGCFIFLCGCSTSLPEDPLTPTNATPIPTEAPTVMENTVTAAPEDNISVNVVNYQQIVEEYNRACALQKEGKYIEAYDVFIKIRDYIDVDDVITKCSYYAGIKFVNEYNIEQARICFETCGEDYEDSKLYLSYLDVYDELLEKYSEYDPTYQFNDMIHIAIPLEDADASISSLYGEWKNEKDAKDIISISEKLLNGQDYKVIACVGLKGLPLQYTYLYNTDTPDEVINLTYNSELNIINCDGSIYRKNRAVKPVYEISGEYTTSNDGMPISVFKHNLYNIYEMSIYGLNDFTKTELDLPSGVGPFKVTALGDTAFERCHKVQKITLPSTITKIGNNVMNDCNSLSEIKLSKNITTIGDNAIMDTQITALTLPKMLETLGENALTNNQKLTELKINKNNKYFTTVDGVLYSKDMKTLIVYPSGKKDKEFIVPDTVTSISAKAFMNTKALERISLPKGLTTLDDSTLIGCSNLKKLVFASNTSIINNELFKGSAALTLEGPYDGENIKNYAKEKKYKVSLAEKPEEPEVPEETTDTDTTKSSENPEGSTNTEA